MHFVMTVEGLETVLDEPGRWNFLKVVHEGDHLLIIGRPSPHSPEMSFWAASLMGRDEPRFTACLEQSPRFVLVLIGDQRNLVAEYAKNGHLIRAATPSRLPMEIRIVQFQFFGPADVLRVTEGEA